MDQFDGASPPPSVAGAILAGLRERGVDRLFVNAGTDWAPFIEAAVQAGLTGDDYPLLIEVPHENAAMSMAHGYALATGRPVAVGVHNNVGTANALCGLMNAQCDQIPLLLIAGRSPATERGSPASREVIVHWAQDMFDQGGIARQTVKWEHDLRAGEAVDRLLDRALDVALTHPRGPVYLMLPREVLVGPHPPLRAAGRQPGIASPVPDAALVERVADWIATAHRPLIVTSSFGRHDGGARLLADLAERFAIGVVSFASRTVNLPAASPAHLGHQPTAAVQEADLILVLDAEVPWIPRDLPADVDARVVHVGIDPIHATFPVRGFPDHLAIAGRSDRFVQDLYRQLADRGVDAAPGVAARRAEMQRRDEARRAAIADAVGRAATAVPIAPAWIAHCLDQVRDAQTTIVNETGLPQDFLDVSDRLDLLTAPPVGGLGWALGAAIGVKMARPERTVIAVMGDGSYMFGNPTPCHYVARARDLPFLTVVMNNAGWASVRRAVAAVYPQGAAMAANAMPLVDLAPSPAFEQVVAACGGIGRQVATPADLPAALEWALRIVREERRQALLNVLCD
jgi:acetolactate synthase-1/2/3 large subunit